MRLIITCIILLSNVCAFSQDNFRSGFIVKISNDTIRGMVRNDIEEKLSKAVIFRSANGTLETYLPQDIAAFGFDGGSVFRVVKYVDPSDEYLPKEQFAKLLFDGTNDLYSFIRKDIYFFVSRVKSDTTLLLFDDIQNSLGQLIEKGNYQNQLFFIGRECEKMRSQAQKVHYNEPALLQYFIALDKCMGNDNASAVHYVKPETVTQVYVFAGGLPVGNNYQVMVQGVLKIILPSQSRRTSLNTGLVYLRKKGIGEYYNFWGTKTEYDHVVDIVDLPLLIQYDLLEKKIRPFVYGGPGLAYKRETEFDGAVASTKGGFGLTIIGGAGIEGYVSKKVFLKIDCRYDLLFHYPVIGIGCRLK